MFVWNTELRRCESPSPPPPPVFPCGPVHIILQDLDSFCISVGGWKQHLWHKDFLSFHWKWNVCLFGWSPLRLLVFFVNLVELSVKSSRGNVLRNKLKHESIIIFKVRVSFRIMPEREENIARVGERKNDTLHVLCSSAFTLCFCLTLDSKRLTLSSFSEFWFI